MSGADARALAMDAESVHDALSTLKWWARGLVSGAGSHAQVEQAEVVLRVIERAEGQANVVRLELARMRDAGGAPAGKGAE